MILLPLLVGTIAIVIYAIVSGTEDLEQTRAWFDLDTAAAHRNSEEH